MKFGVGDSARRIEDPILVTGQGRYTDDVHVEGAARGIVYRSPVAHAKITKLDVDAARKVPGVLAVLTAKEMHEDSIHPIPCVLDIKNADGSSHFKPNRSFWPAGPSVMWASPWPSSLPRRWAPRAMPPI